MRRQCHDTDERRRIPVSQPRMSYVPELGSVPEKDLAKLYLFMNGVRGPNPFGYRANVVDSIPGDALYSPLWRVYAVTWNDGTRARLLKPEQEIHDAEMVKHEITITKTDLVKNSPIVGFQTG